MTKEMSALFFRGLAYSSSLFCIQHVIYIRIYHIWSLSKLHIHLLQVSQKLPIKVSYFVEFET